MRLFQSLEHDLFRNFVSAAFYHRNTFGGACDDDFHISLFNLAECRVYHKLAVEVCHASARNRPVKGNVGNNTRSRTCNNR